MPHPEEFWRSPAGLTYRLHPDGSRTLLVPTGGSGDSDDHDGSGSDDTAGTSDTAAPVGLTQKQIDSIVGRAEKRAARDAEKALADRLGMPLDQAQQALQQQAEQEQARLSEADRRERAAAEREQAAEARERAALDLAARTRVEAALLRAGADARAAARLAPTVEVSHDDDDDTIAAAVDTLRDELPGLFTGSTPGTPKPPGTSESRKPKTAAPTGDADITAFVDGWISGGQGAAPLPTL